MLENKRNLYSQAGQDGIIEYIFNKLMITNGHFIEIGAWDGIHLSNCRKLFKEGWCGAFIESDTDKFEKLKNNYMGYKDIDCINATVTPTNIKHIYKNCKREVDFMSIDVDGIDIEIFEGLPDFLLPKVACIEGGMGPWPYSKRKYTIKGTKKVGQSISVVKNIVENMGYKILCCFQDVIIIKEKYYKNFDVSKNIIELYIDGYLWSPFELIPLHYKNLKKAGRKNLMIEYILNNTKFDYQKRKRMKKYKRRWAKENRKKISEILLDYKRNNLYE